MSLLARYGLHDGTLNDHSGNMNHGTAYGSPILNQADGRIGTAFKCQASSHFYTPFDGNLQEHTLMGWFKVEDWAVSQAMWGTRTGSNGYMLYRNSGDTVGLLRVYYWFVNTSDVTTIISYSNYPFTGLPTGEWFHLAISRSNTGFLKYYINGSLVATQQISNFKSWHVNGTYKLGFGTQAGTSTGYNNNVLNINDVRVYDHVVSDKEVRDAWQANIIRHTFDDDFYGNKLNASPQSNWVTYAPYSTLLESRPDYWKVEFAQTGSGTTTAVYLRNNTTTVTMLSGSYYRISGYMFKNGQPVTVSDASTYGYGQGYENDPQTGWFSVIEYYAANSSWPFHANYGSPVLGDIIECKDIKIERLNGSDAIGKTTYLNDSSGLNHHSAILGNRAPTKSEMWRKTGHGYSAGDFRTISTGFESQVYYNDAATSGWEGKYLTLNAWIYLRSYESDQSPIFEYPFYMNVSSAGKVKIYWYNTSSPGYHSGLTTIPLNTWTMISAVWDGTQAKIYVNGQLDNSFTTSTPGRRATGCRMGYASSTRMFDGFIGLSEMYTSPLTDNDIKSLYSKTNIHNDGNRIESMGFEEFGFNNFNDDNKGTIYKSGVAHPHTLIENVYTPSEVDYSTWVSGTSGNQTDWTVNGLTTENEILEDLNPWGENDILWAATNNDATSGADGGMVSKTIDIDKDSTYRFSIWIQRKVIGNGTWYFGCYGYDENSSNNSLLNLSNSAVNTNPYFRATSASDTDWFLVVGYVYADGTTVATYTDDGVYKADGTKTVSGTTEYKWASTAAKAKLRSYLYYSTDSSTVQYFYRPRIDKMDGSQPTVEDLIYGRDNPNLLNPSNGIGEIRKGGSFYFDEFIER